MRVATGLASVALIGCQLITGIDDLRVDSDASTEGSSEGGAAATADGAGGDAAAAADGRGGDAAAAADGAGEDAAAADGRGGDAAAAVDGAGGDAQVLGDGAGTSDSGARDSGFDVAVCTGAFVGDSGKWTRCMLESQLPQSILNCVDYCASLGSCCATNCVWDPFDPTDTVAEYTSEQSANCADPTTIPSDNTATTYAACSITALADPNAYFKCCCGP
jgi:hypothetical protein